MEFHFEKRNVRGNTSAKEKRYDIEKREEGWKRKERLINTEEGTSDDKDDK